MQQQTIPWSRWRRWRRALVFGLPLGLLEFGLYGLTVTRAALLSPQQATLIGWLLYLLIPGVAGYYFCYQGRSADSESRWSGHRAGLVGSIVVMVGVTVWQIVVLIVYDNSPPPPGPRTFYSPAFALFLTIMLLGLLAIINFVGLAFSAAGGRIGEALASWRVRWLEARGQRI